MGYLVWLLVMCNNSQHVYRFLTRDPSIKAFFLALSCIKRISWNGMHFTHHTKVNDDMEFIIINKLKKLVVKTIRLYNWTSFATKWVKRHGFNNSLITNCICPFWLICSCKGQLQNPKCVVVNQSHFILSKFSFLLMRMKKKITFHVGCDKKYEWKCFY
jgi:hypothetical protein